MKTRNRKTSRSCIQIPGDLTVYTVAAAKDQLLADADTLPNPIRLDLTHVSRIDTAGVQLLLFVKKILSDSNKTLQLNNYSEDFAQTMKTLGLEALLQAED
ncbi:MAG TPA: STAS domain-containing protein [Cellvibrionaceae bacterium]|nr:STAS domain-containing protein [Cellvibrionaceae bacterium]